MRTAMKTTLLAVIILLAVSVNTLFAGGERRAATKSESARTETSVAIGKLAPATPLFAEFTDAAEFSSGPVILTIRLAPVTPPEADFEDTAAVKESLLSQTVSPSLLDPPTPADADFTE